MVVVNFMNNYELPASRKYTTELFAVPWKMKITLRT